MSDTIQFIPQRRFYDTATVAETHRRLLAEGTIFRRMLYADLSVRVFCRQSRLAGSRCCITRTSSNC